MRFLLAFLAGFAAAACSPPAEPPLSLLLVTLDTTNREALSCYGGPAGLTPNLERLAREGIVFENARAVAPMTLPAHASVLTGLYPPRHGLRRNGEMALASEASTLAERLQQAGFQTAAVVAAVVLAPEFGLDQGFERYDAPETPAAVEEQLASSRRAPEVAERALGFLREREPERPFFLWLHFYDPHFPYDPAQEFLERAGGDPYLGEIAAMDASLGRVLDALAEEGALERTLIVAVADHGEGRGRHGEETHGAFVFDSTLRIPMLARLPGARRAGERITTLVSQVDLAPLVLDALGIDERARTAFDVDGRDPLGASDGRGVYFESYFGVHAFGWSPLAGWADAGGKYVHSSEPEFFDLVRDPAETRNALRERADDVERARERIRELCGKPRLAAAPLADERKLEREVERLGYAGGGPGADGEADPLEPCARPSPHRMTQAYADYMQGRKLHEESAPSAESVALLERAVAANPGNHKAWFTLGLARQSLGRFGAAIEAFERVLAEPNSEHIPAELDLAVCLYNLGLHREALDRLERALERTAGPPGALELLIRLYDENGRSEDANRARLRLARRAELKP